MVIQLVNVPFENVARQPTASADLLFNNEGEHKLQMNKKKKKDLNTGRCSNLGIHCGVEITCFDRENPSLTAGGLADSVCARCVIAIPTQCGCLFFVSRLQTTFAAQQKERESESEKEREKESERV